MNISKFRTTLMNQKIVALLGSKSLLIFSNKSKNLIY